MRLLILYFNIKLEMVDGYKGNYSNLYKILTIKVCNTNAVFKRLKLESLLNLVIWTIFNPAYPDEVLGFGFKIIDDFTQPKDLVFLYDSGLNISTWTISHSFLRVKNGFILWKLVWIK